VSERASNPALVVVDMLNPYDHEDAELLTGKVERDAVAHIHDHLADAAIEMMEEHGRRRGRGGGVQVQVRPARVTRNSVQPPRPSSS
jgi:hypothetical protein